MLTKPFFQTLGALLLAILAFAAQALTLDDYSPDLIKKAQTTNQSHAIVFHADWCPSCKAQAKVFEQLKSDPALKNITIYVADHDGEVELKKALKVRGQSTVIVFKGDKEVGRSVADNSPAGLKQILLKSL